MKRVLILTYFFPPGNFAGSYRIHAWTKYLPLFNFAPIVITRHWDKNETDFTALSSETKIRIEKLDSVEVHRLPYKGSIRDRLIKRFGNKASLLGKFFSFFQVIGQNYFLLSVPYRNLYDYTRVFLRKNPDVRLLIASGRPFLLFRFCYLLKKEFPDLIWVADYRDPWNTNANIQSSYSRRFQRLLETRLEQRWVESARCFITCSLGVKDSIKSLVDKNAYIVTNGFENLSNESNIKTSVFEIAYVGNLYENQNIEIFLRGFRNFILVQKKRNIRMVFYGLKNNKSQSQRIINILGEFEAYYKIYPWIQKEELLENLRVANAFLVCGLTHRKGTYTAKVFDYLSMRKNIILCPSDNNDLEDLIRDTNVGVILNTEYEVLNWLNESYSIFCKKGSLLFKGIEKEILRFSYKEQTKVLAELLNSLLN